MLPAGILVDDLATGTMAPGIGKMDAYVCLSSHPDMPQVIFFFFHIFV